MKQIPYGRQEITDDDIATVVEVLKSDYLTQGPAVGQFEQAFAKYIQAPFAVAVSNGTAALHLACMALGVKAGQRVLTTPITFAASANCVRYCGADVEFIDIDPHTRCIDLELLENKLRASKPGTYQGVIPVDFAGYPVDLEALQKLAKTYGLWVIEDACHALGGSFKDSNQQEHLCGNGSLTNFGVFSFHPVKHITTGEGGMIVTADEKLYRKLLPLRTHGITRDPNELKENHGGWYYEMQELGFNYRLTDFQAALGISQLKRLEAGNLRRKEIAKRYTDGLANLPLVLPQVPENLQHGWHLYVVELDRRDDLYKYLRENGVLPQVHYIPVNSMPYYRSLGHSPEQTPQALRYYRRAISLPMYPALTDDDQHKVIEKIREFFKGHA